MKNYLLSLILFFYFTGISNAEKLCFEKIECSKEYEVYDEKLCECVIKLQNTDKDLPVDWRKYYEYIVDKDDKTYLSVLLFELLELEIINKKEFIKIYRYKRKQSDTIAGTKLICGNQPFLINQEDLAMIALEFKSRKKFIGYGFENNDWSNLSGSYKITTNFIELDYNINKDTNKKQAKIDRKKLQIFNGQCAIFNHKMNMNKIMKKINNYFLFSEENKL